MTWIGKSKELSEYKKKLGSFNHSLSVIHFRGVEVLATPGVVDTQTWLALTKVSNNCRSHASFKGIFLSAARSRATSLLLIQTSENSSKSCSKMKHSSINH